MENTEYVIEVNKVSKDYGTFKLDNISFNVPRGSICGFVGQNGAGKTTMIQLILDAIKSDGGNIKVFGKDVVNQVAYKDDIGVVFDEMGFNEYMTPLQIGRMMSYIYSKWDQEEYMSYLEKFGLPATKKCGKFSRGMRMKLQIAVAISHKATLLIMDEPTSGLDPIVRSEILAIFQDYVLDENNTILMSTHITSDLEKIADEIVFINAGKIILQGNKDEILETHGILKCKKEDADTIDKKYIVHKSQSAFGVDVLVNDKKTCAREYPDMTIDSAGLEDIMVFYVGKKLAEPNCE